MGAVNDTDITAGLKRLVWVSWWDWWRGLGKQAIPENEPEGRNFSWV